MFLDSGRSRLSNYQMKISMGPAVFGLGFVFLCRVE